MMYKLFFRWNLVSSKTCQRLHTSRSAKTRGFATGVSRSNILAPVPTSNTALSNAHRVTRGVNKKLHIGNAVTMFYSTIFATALILDIQYKEKRAYKVKEKLETAEMELLELQIEETRLLEGLRERRRKRWWWCAMGNTSPAVGEQKRSYSTSSAPFRWWRPNGNWKRHSYIAHAPPTAPKSDNFATLNGSPHYESIADLLDPELIGNSSDNGHMPAQRDLATDDPLREAALRRLAVRQLAMKFILRPRIAHSYGTAASHDRLGQEIRNMNTSELLSELDEIKKQMMLLKYSRMPPTGIALKDYTVTQQHQLSNDRLRLEDEMRRLFEEFGQDRLHLVELLLLLAQNLLSTEEPVSPAAVELMITQFTRAKQNDLAKMVIEALLPNRFSITLPIIVATINFYTKTRDLFGFDGFMLFLQGLSGPINTAYYWESIRINDIDVPAPVNPRPRFVMNALVYAGISFDQPQRAEAWLALLRETGCIEGPEVLGSYLRYYSLTPNWEKGRHFLLRSLAYLMSITVHSTTAVERLVLYMVVFCNCCARHDLAMVIAKAAAKFGLELHRVYNPRDVRLSVRLALKQWEEVMAVSAAPPATEEQKWDMEYGRRCQEFAKDIEPTLRDAVNDLQMLSPEQEEAFRRGMDDRAFRIRYLGHFFKNPPRSKDKLDEEKKRVNEENDMSIRKAQLAVTKEKLREIKKALETW